MHFSYSGYFQPTPKKIRKIADAVLAAVVFAGSSSALNGYPLAGTVIFVLGFVAKILSNFFSEKKPQKK